MSTPQAQKGEVFLRTEAAPHNRTYYVFKNTKTGALRRVTV